MFREIVGDRRASGFGHSFCGVGVVEEEGYEECCCLVSAVGVAGSDVVAVFEPVFEFLVVFVLCFGND